MNHIPNPDRRPARPSLGGGWIGLLLTEEQMDEYREACEAKTAGRRTRRLDIAAVIGVLIFLGLIVAVFL